MRHFMEGGMASTYEKIHILEMHTRLERALENCYKNLKEI